MPTIREVKNRASSQGVGRADTGMPKQRYERNCLVQGKRYQPAHILLTPECGEKRTAKTSWIALAADRTAECFSKRHLHDSCGADTMCCEQRWTWET